MTFVVIEFGRSPSWFFDCIVSGDALEEHRSAMLAVGRPCLFAEDAKLLVRPEDVNDEDRTLWDFCGAYQFGSGSLRAFNYLFGAMRSTTASRTGLDSQAARFPKSFRNLS
jgi:hypothetical protein